MQKSAILSSRALVAIGGDEAIGFLQNLITCDVESLTEGDTSFGALLTPQGKILFDFLVSKATDGFLIDARSDQADDLAKRLMFYRLRARVDIEVLDQPIAVSWPAASSDRHVDPRDARLGSRSIGKASEPADETAWNLHRIELGYPECGSDFASGTTFPHEALMDQLGGSGVDFSKGCFVGQEVVSRMQHRGTARSRFVKVTSSVATKLPVMGTEVKAGGRTIGTMGSSLGADGLALLRLDRTAEALKDGQPITSGGVIIEPALPGFVTFDWPQ